MAKGNTRKLRNGLTQKENALKNIVLKQIEDGQPVNQTEAAMQVYNVKDRKVARSVASEVLAKPDVKEQIQAALEAKGLSIDKIIGNVGKLASFEPAKVTADVVLRANQDLLKIIGAYPDKKSAHISLNLRGKIGTVGFDEAKDLYNKMNSEVGELVGDTE